MRYLICKGLMTMEEVEPWLEALYKIGPIPAPELKALSLLASALRSCPNWVIKTDMTGQHPQVRLLHHYSEDTTFILDITQMIKESGWKKDIHRPRTVPGVNTYIEKTTTLGFPLNPQHQGNWPVSLFVSKSALSLIHGPHARCLRIFRSLAENGFPDEGTGIKRRFCTWIHL